MGSSGVREAFGQNAQSGRSPRVNDNNWPTEPDSWYGSSAIKVVTMLRDVYSCIGSTQGGSSHLLRLFFQQRP